jgi:hypothetical protein
VFQISSNLVVSLAGLTITNGNEAARDVVYIDPG